MDPVEMLRRGAEILEAVTAPHGFTFEPGEVGKGSGGAFAQGAFVHGKRRLEFSTRHSLGLVQYRLGRSFVSHEDYMRVAAGPGNHAYPGFSNDPLDGFRHLASDLQHFAAVFLEGSDEQFMTLVSDALKARPKGGLGALNPRAS